MTRVSLVVVVLALGLSQAFGQEVEQTLENQPERGLVGRIFDDMKQSARTVQQINKENFAAEREAYRTMYAQVTEPDPAFVSFREAKGLKNKMQVVAGSIKDDCQELSEREREFRGQVMSHEAYRTLLEGQREYRTTTMYRGWYRGW